MDSAGTCYLQAARDLTEAERLQRPEMGLPTVLPGLTELIYGWQPGSLNTVASLTGDGKTTFAIASAIEVLRSGSSAVLISAESHLREFKARILASVSGEPVSSALEHLDGYRKRYLERAEREIEGWNFSSFSMDGLSMIEEVARVRAKTPTGLGMLIVDNFESVQEYRGLSRGEQMAESSRRLKALAVELNIPILLTVQITREHSSESPLSNFISNDLASSSDTVLFTGTHRAKGDWNDQEVVGGVFIAKNRFGTARETVPYTVDFRTQRFSPLIENMDTKPNGNPILRDWADSVLSGKIALGELLQGWTTDGASEEGFSVATLLEVRIAMLSLEAHVDELRASALPVSLWDAPSPKDDSIREILERWKSDLPLDESGPRATPEASILAHHRRELDLEEVGMELAALDERVYYSKSGPYSLAKTSHDFEDQMDSLVALGAVTGEFRSSVTAMREKLLDCIVWELGEHGGNWLVEGTEDRTLAEAAFRGWLLHTDSEQAKERETGPEGPTPELNFSSKNCWFWSPLFPEIEGSESELCNLHDHRERWDGQDVFSGTLITD